MSTKNSKAYDAAWLLKKSGHPATQRFSAKVAEIAEADGLQFDSAWSEARRRFPALHSAMNAVNELPAGAQLSADTQRLIPDWPVPPDVLGALGLPMAATREHYLIFRTAERVKDITPEIAAKIVVTLIRFQQITQGMKFDDTFVALKENFPDIFAALKEAGRGT